MRRLASLLFLSLVVCAPVLEAQEVTQAYVEHAQERGIQTEFYELWRENPAEEVVEPVPQEPEYSLTGGLRIIKYVSYFILILIAAAFIYLIVQNAGLLNVDRIERREEEKKKKTKREYAAQEVQAKTKLYASRKDRFQAVEDMLAETFLKAESDLDLVFGEADTARELERRLRKTWKFHDQVSKLVRASEQSQFAGVPLSSEQYSQCLDAYSKVMGGRI